MLQQLIVALLVACCLVYALWTLAPKAPRARLAQALLKRPLPAMLRKPVEAAARQQGGCGCDGCDSPARAKPGAAADPAQPAVQPVHFMRGAGKRRP